MTDVITLSDDDDIEILTPPPPVVLKPNSSVNHIGTVQGATAHISTVTKLNLDQLGLSRTSINVNKPKPRLNVAAPVMRAPIPITPQQRFHISARNGKRPSPSPAVPNSSTPSTSTQRTRNNQNTSAASQTYKGHYMFEATEGYEPSRRSTRFTKKIEGKFVCSYNPTTCYKLFGTAIALINHVWSHVAYDSPVGPPTEQESLEDALYFTLRKRPGVVLSHNSTLALERMRTCEFCNGKFISLHKKQQHVTKCHLEEEKEPTTCNICEVDFETVPSYQVHAKKHISGDAPYNCQKCKYRTSVRHYFFEHFVEKHCTEALLCPLCFYQEDLRPSTRRSKHIFARSFIEHMRTHATCRQFRCHLCALTFNSRGEQEHHIANDHSLLNPLWQVQERPSMHDRERERMMKHSKINLLQRKFFETLEGRRISDEVSCQKNVERLGYDLTSTGNTLYKCECGFNSWNGNRTASHFHKCRKSITTVAREREVCRHQNDPKDELEMFAVYPQPTETEKETEKLQNAILRKLHLEDNKLIKPNTDTYDFQPIDDLLLLKSLSSSKQLDFSESALIEKCLDTILLAGDE